jgi:hypothetical protein
MRLVSFNSLENLRHHLHEAKKLTGKFSTKDLSQVKMQLKSRLIGSYWLPIGTDTENPETFEEKPGLAILKVVQ